MSLFFFHDTALTLFYTLSLHDALPIFLAVLAGLGLIDEAVIVIDHAAVDLTGIDRLEHGAVAPVGGEVGDRKSTRLNSSHVSISYAVFCLKKKKKNKYENYSLMLYRYS